MIPNNGYPPRHKNPKSRPYSRKRKYGASVTTVLGSLGGGEGLMHGAVNETTNFVLDFPERYEGVDRDAAFAIISKHFRGLWDGRAGMGTLSHTVNEKWTWGEEADIDALVAELAWADERPVQIWQGRESFIAAEAEGYVDGLEAFWQDFQPRTIGTEEIVRYDDKNHGYIGTRDWTCELEGYDGVWLLDLKTTAKKADDKNPGLYFDKFRLQLASYRMAKEIVRFDESGEIVESWPNYPVAHCGIVHLRGDGKYELYRVQAAGDEWATFLRLVDLHRWATTGWKKPAAENLTPSVLMELDELAAEAANEHANNDNEETAA